MGRLTPEQSQLASDHLWLARHLTRRHCRSGRGREDEAESVACWALVLSARDYDPSRGARFATYATRRIWWALWEHRRIAKIEKAAELAFDPEARAEPEDPAEALEEWLRKLPAKLAEVCRMYYLDGMTQSQIAERLGLFQNSIKRRHDQAIRLLSDPYDETQGRPKRRNRVRTP